VIPSCARVPCHPGAQGATGCSAFKGNTFVIVCVHDDTIQPGQCSATGGKLADYLIEQGM